MKTYFIAGYSIFPSTQQRTDFWRVMNIDDKTSPHELLDSVIEEMEASDANLYHTHLRYKARGEIVITTFNQV